MQAEISDWLTLVIDTYEELKQETTTSTKAEDGAAHHSHHHGESSRKSTTINTGGSSHNKLNDDGNHAVDAILRASIIPGQGLIGNHSNDIDQNDAR